MQFNLVRGEGGRGAFGVDERGRARGGGVGERKMRGRERVDEQTEAERARIAGVRPVFKKIGGAGRGDEEKQVPRFNVSTAPYGQTFKQFKSRVVRIFDADAGKENEPPLSPTDSMEPLATIEEEDEGTGEDAAEEDEKVDEGEKEKPDPFAVCRLRSW